MRRTTHRPMPFKTHAPVTFYVQTHSGGGQTQMAKLRRDTSRQCSISVAVSCATKDFYFSP